MALSTIDELIRAGWGYVLVARIEGIHWLFAEHLPKRATAATPVGVPSGFDGVCPALVIPADVSLTQEIDRETGVARGDAFPITLAWDALEDDGLLVELFRRPTLKVRITEDLDHDETSWDVETTAGVGAAQRLHIGREQLRVDAVVDADTLTVTRGVLGFRYDYRADSPSSFSFVTDVPEVWIGRFVTLYRHVLTPEGRMLDATWTEGDYCDVVWRGFIDSQPRRRRVGMYMRALPLFRLLGKPLGYKVGLRVVTPDPEDAYSFGTIPIVAGPTAQIRIRGSYSGPSSGTFDFLVPSDGTISTESVMSIQGWTMLVRTDLDALVSAEPWASSWDVEVGVIATVQDFHVTTPGQLIVKIPYDASFTITSSLLTVQSERTYWLTPTEIEGDTRLGPDPIVNWNKTNRPLVGTAYPAGSWLPVEQTSGQGYQDLEIPASGAAMVEVEAAKELIRWTELLPFTNAPLGTAIKLLRIAERQVAGTQRVDLVVGAKLTLVSGADGTPAACLLTMLESSGTGDRGTYDTLGLALGLGIPDDYIDEAGILAAASELGESTIAAYVDGRTSVEDLLGGWLALLGLCLVQRTIADGSYRLTLVQAEPGPLSGDYETIDVEDVELYGIDDPEAIDEVYEVSVERSGPASDVPDVVVRDVPAIQAGAAREVQFSAPGAGETMAQHLGASRIATGLGADVGAMPVAPWLALEVGDLAADETAHPAGYDWSTGTRAPARVPCRVVGTRWWPYDGRRAIVLLQAGILGEGFYFAPGLTIASFTTTTITVHEDPAELFSPDGDPITVRVYDPGYEATRSVEIDVTVSGYVITLVSGTLDAWVDTGCEITLADLGAGNHADVEDHYLFQAAARQYR